MNLSSIEFRIKDEFNTVRAWVALHQLASLAAALGAGILIGWAV